MTPIFARIYKIDEQNQTVTGRAVQEIVDNSGEIFDYSSSAPLFRAWSADVFASSNGASYGNVRSMHGSVAAGKLTDIEFNDAEKAIDVTAKIVDPVEFDKCAQGVMTGFSIGGSYAKKWADVVDGKMVTRYTAAPNEISIVDRPAVPTAKFFQVRKCDGRVVKRRFARRLAKLELADGKVRLIGGEMGAATRMIKSLHAQGGRRFGPGALVQKAAPERITDRSVAAMRKALSMPPQSSNGVSGGAISGNTGAGDDWRDQVAPKAKPIMIGGQVIGKPSQTNMDAATDAIKRDLARGAKRLGV